MCGSNCKMCGQFTGCLDKLLTLNMVCLNFDVRTQEGIDNYRATRLNRQDRFRNSKCRTEFQEGIHFMFNHICSKCYFTFSDNINRFFTSVSERSEMVVTRYNPIESSFEYRIRK